MKKVLVAAGLIAFFLAIVALVLYAFVQRSPGTSGGQTTGAGFPSGAVIGTTGTNESAPAKFSEQFYAWYLSHLASDYTFTTSSTFSQDLAMWATPEFVAAYPSLVKQDEIDPIIFAQDFLPSWTTNITASVKSQSATDADVLVSLGTGAELKKIEVRLAKGTDGWKVSAISKAN